MNNYLTDVHYDKRRILYEACITGQAECARLLKFAIPLRGRRRLLIGRPDGAQGRSITVIGRLSSIRTAYRPMHFRLEYSRDRTSIFVPNARPSGRCSENVTASRLGSVEGRSKFKLNQDWSSLYERVRKADRTTVSLLEAIPRVRRRV